MSGRLLRLLQCKGQNVKKRANRKANQQPLKINRRRTIVADTGCPPAPEAIESFRKVAGFWGKDTHVAFRPRDAG